MLNVFNCEHIHMQGVILCLWLRHSCVRAARLQGLWNSGEDGGGYCHHAAEHWRWGHPAICPHAWILGWCLSYHVSTEHQPQYILSKWMFVCLLFAAMSSYLYIVKYEFPLVIQAFLKVDNPAGWGSNTQNKHPVYPIEMWGTWTGHINCISLCPLHKNVG